ncbi:MAG TPA: hypothetical protein VFF00_11315 [Candidatus Elarobacter sp.]|nr:hypothetical protein [Candidatus Elarobacter sp.]
MSQDAHPKNPIDAHREGLEQLERAPHHHTTEHEKSPHDAAPQPAEPPGERHRGGPLPNLKK